MRERRPPPRLHRTTVYRHILLTNYRPGANRSTPRATAVTGLTERPPLVVWSSETVSTKATTALTEPPLIAAHHPATTELRPIATLPRTAVVTTPTNRLLKAVPSTAIPDGRLEQILLQPTPRGSIVAGEDAKSTTDAPGRLSSIIRAILATMA